MIGRLDYRICPPNKCPILNTKLSGGQILKALLFMFKETKSATMNIFRKESFSFLKVELSYVFTINLFTIAENCMEK